MKITEWFSRGVASGIILRVQNIKFSLEHIPGQGENKDWYLIFDGGNCVRKCDIPIPINTPDRLENPIQLRKDGVDLYHLEWIKPTKEDIGKMCWVKDEYDDRITIMEFSKKMFLLMNPNSMKLPKTRNIYYRVLIASHGQICPKLEDFKQVYGDDYGTM